MVCTCPSHKFVSTGLFYFYLFIYFIFYFFCVLFITFSNSTQSVYLFLHRYQWKNSQSLEVECLRSIHMNCFAEARQKRTVVILHAANKCKLELLKNLLGVRESDLGRLKKGRKKGGELWKDWQCTISSMVKRESVPISSNSPCLD